jgi:6-pyruvoyltetrahydropterin/6-carboxytetrahydropterin synthase
MLQQNAELKKMFSVKVQVEFAAAHHIRGYDGECARPHGHNWKIQVEARTAQLNQIGIAVDFKVLKALVKVLIEKYDHQDLNTIEPFQDLNPTAETMAMVFYNELEKMIASKPPFQSLQLTQVTVWENDRSAAAFGLV